MRIRKGAVAMVTGEEQTIHRDSLKRTKQNLRVRVCGAVGGAVGRKAGRMTRKADQVSCALCIEGQRTHSLTLLQQQPRRVPRWWLKSLDSAAAK